MIEITAPTLLVDEQKCRANIKMMAEKARRYDLGLKPHFKTHQSADIGAWFREEEVEAITVSSVEMAEYFAKNGWEDITIAFPCNLLEHDRIDRLASQVQLTLLISDVKTPRLLASRLNHSVSVFIEIDTGSDRSGFDPGDKEAIDGIIRDIESSDRLHFKGFYSHPGHTYAVRSRAGVESVHRDVLGKMEELGKTFDSADKPLKVCIGDTPSCVLMDDFSGIDEISPGNFVFYDLTQSAIGSCSYDQIAVAMACPVVAVYPSRNKLIVHCGAVHLSKDQLDGHFGRIVALRDDGWDEPLPDAFVTSISQEHGVLKADSGFIGTKSVGDVIGILPVHSCLTADLMAGYRVLQSGSTLNHMKTDRSGQSLL